MLEQPPVFGAELRRSRIAAGLTLTEFAASVHYSKGQVSKVETGRKKPSVEFARLCDAALGTGGALTALVPADGLPLVPPEPGDKAGAEMRRRRLPKGTVPDTDRVPPNRRQVMAVGAATVLGLGPAAGSARAVEAPSAVDADSGPVASCRALFDQYRHLGQVTAPGVLLPALAEQTRSFRDLADRSGPRTKAALLNLTSRYAEFAGWMAQEAGDDAAALRWTDHAVELADAAGDHDLAAYSLVRRGLISYYQGDAADAIALADSARSSRLPARVRGLATQQLAQGHALAGNHSTCLRSLDRARELLAADRPDPALPVLGASHLPDPITVITGWCLVDLGRPREAAALLDKACAALPPQALRTQARYGVRRALAHTLAGEVEQACSVVRPLLPAAWNSDSATIRLDLRRLARALGRFRAVPAVAEVSPAITAALHSHAG
ncbi:helix-turn-helix transcriptional regulator [Streptomyces huasconensis]|uniref:Helix-turn-helix transcriptional regulator n=1 Tax=Streptomyces huasconensis TaxID=1854574 RepID=A0ABV3LWN1_9ACTN